MLKFNLKQFGIDIRNFDKGEKIGRGGFSEVFLAQYKKTGDYYAAKVLKSNVFREEEKKKVENEIEIMMSICHPTIIRYFGYSLLDFCLNPSIVIFTEYAKNGSLRDIISKAKKSNLPEVYDNTTRQIILIGISCGMKYLHNQNIMHRDLKTNNILLDDNYYPHIIDFGMAKYVPKNSVWEKANIFGTLPYMAPDIILGKSYSYKIDVYSFGILMYEVICESDLYPGIANKESITNEFKNQVAISNVRPEFKKEIKNSLKRLIQKCWSNNVSERPNFDDIYQKLTSSEYYLDNVDESRIKKYIEYISRNDVYNSNNVNMIEKVNNLSIENENLRRQIKSLKEENEKLSNNCIQLKKMVEESIFKKNNDSKVTVKPPSSKDGILALNSPRVHHLNENEPKPFLTPQKVGGRSSFNFFRIDNADIESKPLNVVLRQKEGKEENIVYLENKKEDVQNSPLRKIKFSPQTSSSPRRLNPFSRLPLTNDRKEQETNVKSFPVKEPNKEKEEPKSPSIPPKKQIIYEDIKSPSIPPKKQIIYEDIKSPSVSPKTQIIYEDIKSPSISLIKPVINEEKPIKLPSLIKCKRHEVITLHEFNSLSLQQQLQVVKSKIISMNSAMSISKKPRNQFVINLYKLLNYFIQKVELPDGSGYMTIQTTNQEDKFDNICKSNHVNILSKTTEILYDKKLLESDEFEEFIRLFNHISIEIKYFSRIYQSAYRTVFSMDHVKIKIFISGMKKTDNTFKENKFIRAVRFDQSVANISDYAFKNCQSLKQVTIPSSVSSIGPGAFEGCYSLKAVSIPSSINLIDFSVFKGCADLSEVSLTNSIKLIRNNAFYNCESLKNISIPSSVSSIGDYAFFGCSSLESISIPSSVVSIGEFAFSECSELTQISIAASVNSIGKNAFKGCNKLIKITIPSSISNINLLGIKNDCTKVFI